MRRIWLITWLISWQLILPAQDSATRDALPESLPHERPLMNERPISGKWQRNGLLLPADSIRVQQQEQDLVYLQSFDSVLKAVKAGESALRGRAVQYDTEPAWLERFFASDITMYFLWTLAVFFSGYILYRLFMAGMFVRSRGAGTILPDDLPVSADGVQDWYSQAHTCAGNGDYRMAVRCLYLYSLQQLNERGAIRLTADKTNARYLAELAGTPYRYYAAELFRYYEFSWYGDFPTDEAVFLQVKNRLQLLLQQT